MARTIKSVSFVRESQLKYYDAKEYTDTIRPLHEMYSFDFSDKNILSFRDNKESGDICITYIERHKK